MEVLDRQGGSQTCAKSCGRQLKKREKSKEKLIISEKKDAEDIDFKFIIVN